MSIAMRASDAVLYDSIPEADRTITFRHAIAHGYDVINEAQRLFNTEHRHGGIR